VISLFICRYILATYHAKFPLSQTLPHVRYGALPSFCIRDILLWFSPLSHLEQAENSRRDCMPLTCMCISTPTRTRRYDVLVLVSQHADG